MPYIPSVERIGKRNGMREGIRALLKMRFGDEGLKLMPEIEEGHEEDKLRAIIDALEDGKPLDDIRGIWISPTQ
jgi:hypothetical protein